MNAIDIHGLAKSFGDKTVLDGVDLYVEQGEFFGLVGANGSGKTTLIKCLLDLLSIDSGEIRLLGGDHRVVESRSEVSYLPDRFAPPAHLRGGDFIDYMLALHNRRCSNEDKANMLTALDLDSDAMQSPVNSLSKGMTQKLGLASCLLSGKSLLILDEPMSGLDPRARVLFKQQLRAMKQQGLTLFFSSHVLVDVDELADRIAVLHDSKILFTGTSVEFKHNYDSTTLEQAYMKCIQRDEAA